MIIRPATGADAPALAALSGQLGYPSEAEEIAGRLAALRELEHHAVLVAEETGRVVAWVHILGARHLMVDPFAEVGGLVVDAAWRGRGLGTALLAVAEAWAAERGYATMRIRSNIIREEAHRFYGARGYSDAKRQVVFARRLVRTVPAGGAKGCPATVPATIPANAPAGKAPMAECARIADLLRRALDGDPWYGRPLLALIANLSAEEAARRPLAGAHSIWEVLLHMTAWMRETRARLADAEPGEPAAGDWPALTGTTAPDWERARAELISVHEDLCKALAAFPEDRLDETVGGAARSRELGTGVSFYVMLHGLIQHNVYHAGQIAARPAVHGTGSDRICDGPNRR